MEKHTAFDLLLETGLRHLYKAEVQVRNNLVVMAKAALSQKLTEAFNQHVEETDQQLKRLDRIFEILDINLDQAKIKGIPNIKDQATEMVKTLIDFNFTDRSKAMEGLISEGQELMRHFAGTEAIDAALTSIGQKVEHLEIACYESLILWADRAGYPEVVHLLSDSLEEERRESELISQIAHYEIQLPELAHR